MSMPPPGYAPPPMPSRPLGVTILAILSILLGIGLLFLGLIITAFGGLAAIVAGPMGGLVLVFGLLFFIVGLLLIAAGIGLLKLRPWAWWLAIIAFVIGLISAVGQASWFVAAFEVLLIVYLIAVRKHFVSRPAGM